MPIKHRKPKVCFLRGSYLNPFEVQYLEPLQDRFDILLAHPGFKRYDLRSVTLPCKKIPCVDYLNGILPQQLFNRLIPNILKYFGYEEVLLNLKNYLRGFDIVHVPEQSFYFTWQAAKLKQDLRYKLVTTQDEINPFWYSHRKPIFKRASVVRLKSDLLLARSLRAKKALMVENVKPNKIRVVGHGIDTKRFYPAEKNKSLCHKLRIPINQFIILFVGRLVWTKGIFILVDAAKLLIENKKTRERNPLFLIVGDGPERPEFENRIKLLGIEKYFQLLGNQSYQLLPDIHRLADIFVLPSISTRYILEQFGIVLIESMACKKPVITTYCGAIDEVIGDCGILVQPNDYYRLYKAMEKLILNEDMRLKFGELGKKRVEKKFTNIKISELIADAYYWAMNNAKF